MQGSSLLGTLPVRENAPGSSVVVSVDLTTLHQAGPRLEGVSLVEGRLLVSAAPLAPERLDHALMMGTSSEGKPVELAICGVERDASDPATVRYTLEYWDEQKQGWANPCFASTPTRKPRALVLGGTWDARGAHQDAPGRVTFACEEGAAAKCVELLGYKPWQSKNGQSLAPLHQACTRVLRADYCGDGQSHTRNGTMVDVEDRAGVQAASPPGEAAVLRLQFESAFDQDGAVCLARTRQGEPLEQLMAACPGRFKRVSKEVRKGERCVLWRTGAKANGALIWNRSLPPVETAANKGQ